MKKYIYIILSIMILNIFSINVWASEDYSKILKKIPDNFSDKCYQNIYKINSYEIKNQEKKDIVNNYKLKINNYDDLTITQSWFILPYKEIWEELNNIKYYDEYDIEVIDSNDDNENTYIELDTLEKKEVVYKLEKWVLSWNFDFNIDFESKSYDLGIYISKNNEDFSKVSKNNINDFDFKYIKLRAECKNLWCVREKIKIKELNIKENNKEVIIKSFFDEEINIFSNYRCSQKEFDDTHLYYDNFSMDNKTKTIDIELKANKNFNPQKKLDNDNDWIENDKDNCINISNKDQKDSNSDWKWDACSDDDNDWIIWKIDNCPLLYNPKQIDLDNNNIWDECEKDKDNDWVYDKIDNCPLISNSEQIDSDNDWIWDVCDNCIDKYNKDQKDIDKDWIWDKCDLEDNREIESNKGLFLILFWFITIIFWVAIYFTYKKLNNI